MFVFVFAFVLYVFGTNTTNWVCICISSIVSYLFVSRVRVCVRNTVIPLGNNNNNNTTSRFVPSRLVLLFYNLCMYVCVCVSSSRPVVCTRPSCYCSCLVDCCVYNIMVEFDTGSKFLIHLFVHYCITIVSRLFASLG